MKFKLFPLVLFFLTSCVSTSVVHLNRLSKPLKDDGVYFMLPKTRIQVDVTIKKLILHKGPFAEFAGKLLGIQNVILTEKTAYSIENFEIKSVLVPDSSQQYFLVHPGHRTHFLFSGFNLLSGINERCSKDIKQIQIDSIVNTKESGVSNLFKYFADNKLFEKIDTVTEVVHADTASFLKKVLKKTFIEKPNNQRAEEAADYILKIRQNRLNILSATNEVAFQKESIAYMSEQLEKIENEYMTLFTGVRLEETETMSFFIEPTPAQTEYHLFNFSASDGVVTDKADSVFIRIKPSHFHNRIPGQAFSLRGNSGFPVRIAEPSEIMLFMNKILLYKQSLPVLQLGWVNRVPFQQYTKLQWSVGGELIRFSY